MLSLKESRLGGDDEIWPTIGSRFVVNNSSGSKQLSRAAPDCVDTNSRYTANTGETLEKKYKPWGPLGLAIRAPTYCLTLSCMPFGTLRPRDPSVTHTVLCSACNGGTSQICARILTLMHWSQNTKKICCNVQRICAQSARAVLGNLMEIARQTVFFYSFNFDFYFYFFTWWRLLGKQYLFNFFYYYFFCGDCSANSKSQS